MIRYEIVTLSSPEKALNKTASWASAEGRPINTGKRGPPPLGTACATHRAEWGLDAEVKGNRSRVEREKAVWGCREERHREQGFPALSERRYSESAGGLFFSAICIKVIFSMVSRYFVFFALGYLVLWESYSHLSTFYTHGLADRAYGLWIICWPCFFMFYTPFCTFVPLFFNVWSLALFDCFTEPRL